MVFTITKKRRVFLVFYNMGLGGVQTKMLDVANTLVSQGYECWVLLDEKGEHDRIGQFDPRVRVTVCWDHPRLSLWPFRRLRRMRFILFVITMMALFRPACLFVSLCTLAAPIVSFFRRFYPSILGRIIINEDTYPSLEFSYNHPFWGRPHLSRVYSQVKRVIAVSKSTYADLHDAFGIPSPPLVYLPNWIQHHEKDDILSNNRKIDILFGGRLDPQKRPFLLFEMIELLLIKRPDLVVRLYGDGLLFDAVDKKIALLNATYNIQRKNPVQDFRPILQDSKIILFTSLYEGLPFVGLEAMAYGAVLAGLDVPGVRDVIVDGKTGLLAKSTEELSMKVITLLGNNLDRKRLAANALLQVKREFSVKNRDKLIKLILE